MTPMGRICGQCHFDQFFRQSGEAMFITTREGRFLEVNRNMATLLGYTAQELLHMRVSDILESAPDRRAYQTRIETDGAVHQYPLMLRHRNGSPIPGAIDAVVVRDPGGVVLGYHGIIRTRTEVLDAFRSWLNGLPGGTAAPGGPVPVPVEDPLFLYRTMSDGMLDYLRDTGRNPLATTRMQVSVLFFDIRDSTAIAEKLEPEVFASFLNDILTDIMDLVYGCSGTVNKLMGDGLMATFGTPEPAERDAFHAVECGRMIGEYLKTFNDVRPDFLEEPVRAGIGIATGEVFAGVIGSVRRQEYTVLGDPVNLASRLEALTRKCGCALLMDQSTRDIVREEYGCHRAFTGTVRGRTGVMDVWGLGCDPGEPGSGA